MCFGVAAANSDLFQIVSKQCYGDYDGMCNQLMLQERSSVKPCGLVRILLLMALLK